MSHGRPTPRNAAVTADMARTWNTLVNVDLIDVGRRRPMAGILGALRTLPDLVSHLLHREGLPDAATHLRLRELSTLPIEKGGGLLSDRPCDEIAFGLVGRFLAAGHLLSAATSTRAAGPPV